MIWWGYLAMPHRHMLSPLFIFHEWVTFLFHLNYWYQGDHDCASIWCIKIEERQGQSGSFHPALGSLFCRKITLVVEFLWSYFSAVFGNDL
jgi:hypothetical protein